MNHVSPDDLAGSVIDAAALDGGQRAHLGDCPQCRVELEWLQRTAQVLATGGPPELVVPGARVWSRIEAELGDELDARPPEPAPVVRSLDPARSSPSRSNPARSERARSRLPMVLAAAAVGVLLGAGGAVLAERLAGPRTEVLAAADLAALPGHTGSGSAELVRIDGVASLRVSVTGGAPASEYRELWLINTDGERMYSLGVLPPSGAGTYPVPPQLDGSLNGFTIVDVSNEPYDGDARHSFDSQVRGTLPV